MCRLQIDEALKKVRSLSSKNRAIERDMALERLIVKGVIEASRKKKDNVILECKDMVDLIMAGLL